MRLWMVLSAALAISVPLLAVQWHWERSAVAAPAPPEPVLTLHDTSEYMLADETPEFAGDIEAALGTGNGDALERESVALRSPDAIFLSGEPKLFRFYEALASYPTENGPDGCHGPNPQAFEEKAKQLERWRAAMPRSLAAKIALARLWEKGAWDARGCGWSSEVSHGAWGEVRKRLAEAEWALSDVDLDADPMGYYVFIGIGALRSFERDRLDNLYERAIRAFPRFFPLYGERANDLQTKWFGRDGELQAYLSELRNRSNGPDGEVAYTFAVDRLLRNCVCNAIYKDMGQDLPTIIAAYQVREQRYGLRNRDWNAIFAFSIYGGAREPAHQALLQIGDKWDANIWTEKKYFDDVVAWFHANSRY